MIDGGDKMKEEFIILKGCIAKQTAFTICSRAPGISYIFKSFLLVFFISLC